MNSAVEAYEGEAEVGGIANQLADFAAGLSFDDIPETVRTRAKHLVLDAVGIAHASGPHDFAQVTLKSIHELGGDGDFPVIGTKLRLPVRDAAFLNGLLIHGLDFDDTHTPGVIHTTTSTFPCALAAAALAGASGREMLTAYIIGVEAASRLATVVKGALHQIGFHPTGVMGAFGCALVAGRLLGLDRHQLAMAQGIVLSAASGSLEFLEDGAWTKRFHPGWAAVAGITAAKLASDGFVGATRPYEGRFGLYNAYLDEKGAAGCDLSIATAGLGSSWELSNVAIKPFPACHFTHGCIDAALKLHNDHGVRGDAIKHVRALVPQEVVKAVCEPVANKRRPANTYDAEFSIPFLVAAALTRGKYTLDELDDESLRDPAILAIADKVDYEIDPNSGFPKYYSGEVIVETNDGRELGQREHKNRGCSENPISNEEIVAKFESNAARVTSDARVAAVRELILTLDQGAEATHIGDCLAAQ